MTCRCKAGLAGELAGGVGCAWHAQSCGLKSTAQRLCFPCHLESDTRLLDQHRHDPELELELGQMHH